MPGGAASFLALREARPEDRLSLYEVCFNYFAQPYFEAGFQRILREQAAGRSVMLVAETGGVGIIGSGQLVRYGRARAEIADLEVVAGWRGRGVGTALIQVLSRVAQAHGIRCLEIGATEDNERALALYRRLGFLPSREVTIPDGGRALFLVKELPSSEIKPEPV